MNNKNKISQFKQSLQSKPEAIEFQDVISLIDELYDFTATEFTNGAKSEKIVNKAGENNGSCKIFSFAEHLALNKQQTLFCFGQYYRIDVLNHPDNCDHANIRTFIKYGMKHIKFTGVALQEKQS